MFVKGVMRSGVLGAVSLVAAFTGACAMDDMTDATAPGTPAQTASSTDGPTRAATSNEVHAPPATPAAVGGHQVGYYDMTQGVGADYQIAPITAAGGTPVTVFDPSAANLTGLNVLFVNNEDNGAFGFGYTQRLADIQAAVQNGLVLVIHDRLVQGANEILPGGAGFATTRDFTEGADINIHDGSTVVTAGLDDTSLDGGNFSSHGFTTAESLPANAKLILSATTPDHIVTFCYPFGKGAVIYSSIPLDFYLLGGGLNPPQTALATIYAPNVVTYAIAGACAKHGGPVPTPN
jgi:hypothetical protein